MNPKKRHSEEGKVNMEMKTKPEKILRSKVLTSHK